MDVELFGRSVDVNQTEERIVSKWIQISADPHHPLFGRVDEILQLLGFETRPVVMERENSIAMFFMCLTMTALMSLREQWRSGQLRVIVQKLFTLLSDAAKMVDVERLIWPQAEYDYCLSNFQSLQG